jgi:DNA-directed RNA polymerase specialized sigma24 family protein
VDTARYTAAYRAVFRLIGDSWVADGLAREAMVRASATFPRPGARSLETRTCLQAVRLALHDELWLGQPRGLPSGTGFGGTANARERRNLRSAVRVLMGRQRLVFVLQHLAGWEPERVASECGMTVQAVAQSGRKAESAVQRRMNEQTAQGGTAPGAKQGGS